MATPNYSYEKRQRELAKKRKKEEKLKKRTEQRTDVPADDASGHDMPPRTGSDSAPSESEPPPAAP